MLRQILAEFEKTDSSLSLNELGEKLGIESSALEAMVAHLVRMGKLRDDEGPEAPARGATCGTGCAACPVQGCPFAMRLPRTYSLPSRAAGKG